MEQSSRSVAVYKDVTFYKKCTSFCLVIYEGEKINVFNRRESCKFVFLCDCHNIMG
jgi:hypothetical protein